MPTSSGTKNIFLTSREAGDVKVGDFGLSRALSQSTSELALTVCGTPFYLSPELVSGSPYGVPADLWSLGVVLFELLNPWNKFANFYFLCGGFWSLTYICIRIIDYLSKYLLSTLHINIMRHSNAQTYL
mgnify:CR=1 FL=1